MNHCALGALRETAAGGGVTAPRRVTLYCPESDTEFDAKWKLVPRALDDWNNSPRHEMAAYQLQQLFLDPNDYVVPPSVVRCTLIDVYRHYFPEAAPSIRGTRCALGNLSLWLQNVKRPDPLYDPERFEREPNYAYHMANFNLLTHLMNHKDGRGNNWLVSKNDDDRRIYSIDNGIAFDARIYNYFVRNWNDLRVPALSRKSVDRLREVTPSDVEKLGVLEELRLDASKVYRPAPNAENMHPSRGVRRAKDRVQFGLTTGEIDDVWERIQDVIERVDDGEIPVF